MTITSVYDFRWRFVCGNFHRDGTNLKTPLPEDKKIPKLHDDANEREQEREFFHYDFSPQNTYKGFRIGSDKYL